MSTRERVERATAEPWISLTHYYMFLIISFTLTLGQAQTNGVLLTLPLPPRERAARVDQDVNLVRAVRVADPQVLLQMIKDGVSRVRVGVLPRRPLVNQARAAVVRVNQERVAVPQAVHQETGVSFCSIIDYLHTLHSIIFPLLTTYHHHSSMFNLHRQARRLGRMGFRL